MCSRPRQPASEVERHQGVQTEARPTPCPIQEQAAQAYALWISDPFHPSLQFKRISLSQPIYSVRVGIGYRALGLRHGEHVDWFWIGSHAEYDVLLKRL